jgi:protein involved in polysaccharide export with SLBB domain
MKTRGPKTEAKEIDRAALIKAGMSAQNSRVRPGDRVRTLRAGVEGTYLGMMGKIILIDWSRGLRP